MPGGVSLLRGIMAFSKTFRQTVNSVSPHITFMYPRKLTGYIIGELEGTIFERFCEGQNLRAQFATDDMKKNLPKIQRAFSAAFQNDARGTLLNDMLAFEDSDKVKYGNTSKTSLLPPEHHALVLGYSTSGIPVNPTRHVFMQTSIQTQGMAFSTSKTSYGNSLVVYRHPDGCLSAPWRAGKIVSIFVCKQPLGDNRSMMSGPFFVVENYTPLSDAEASHDCYRRYGDSGGRLFYPVHDGVVLLSIKDIICHFACTTVSIPKLKGDLIHVLPLARVSRHSVSCTVWRLTLDFIVAMSYILHKLLYL